MKVEQSDIMDDVVESSLGESTVDVTERNQPVFCHTARERDGMSFGNADIEGAVGHLLHHDIHRATGRHGRCHTDDFRILLCQFQKGVSKDILILLGFVRVFVHQSLTCLWVKLSWSMPCCHVFLCRGITMSFLRMQV